ncbi:MAG TPA: ABC transporter ATP-binding protein [Polyangiaceae bacterium]|nr:ABC transporter ATP-binding protein [Polyangiaceae bacterium]
MTTEETTAGADAKKVEAKQAEAKQEEQAEENATEEGMPESAAEKKEALRPDVMPPSPYADDKTGEKKKKKKKDVETAVHLRKLTKRFGAKTAVDEVTLSIRMGHVYGLIGPNGAGKTTTFSMMAGYLHPTEGSVEILGFKPSAVDELRSRVGVLPQDALLPANDRVGEFLVHMARLQDYPSDKAEGLAREALADVEGKEWWTQRCGSLSHGMAKRVALAQAFLGEPDVVLLDEPTAGLDPRVAYEMRQLIKAKKGRCTIIISSHNLQELEEICDAAAILDRGRLVASGSMNELTASNEEVRVKVASGTKRGTQNGQVPVTKLEVLAMVRSVHFDDEAGEIVIGFERSKADAETVIGHVLWILLHSQVRISGVTKGRGLEQRVMDLT